MLTRVQMWFHPGVLHHAGVHRQTTTSNVVPAGHGDLTWCPLDNGSGDNWRQLSATRIHLFYVCRIEFDSLWKKLQGMCHFGGVPCTCVTSGMGGGVVRWHSCSQFANSDATKRACNSSLLHDWLMARYQLRIIITICSDFELLVTWHFISKGLKCVRSAKFIIDKWWSDTYKHDESSVIHSLIVSELLS